MTDEPNTSDPESIDDPPLDFSRASSAREKFSRPRRGDSVWVKHQHATSQSVTIRMIFLVGLLVMVIWGMRISGRAESWQWLFGDSAGAGSNGSASDSAPLDSSESPATTIQIPANDIPANDGSSSNTDNSIAEITDSIRPETVTDYELEFARRFLKSLSGRDSFTFWQVVKSAVDHTELPVGETASAATLVNRMAEQWSSWNHKWDAMFDEGSVAPEQRASVLETRDRWEATVLPALAAVTIRPDNSLNKDDMLTFRQTVERAADLLVSQYTHVSRPVETYAWFSAWADVFNQPVSIEKSSLPSPTITQLLGQPEAWVGQTISVSGTALRVQRVGAGMNPQKIAEYFVIWIRPDHPSMYPFCVYTLMPPEKLALSGSEFERNISVPVAVAGRFFKIRLFDAGGKAGQAPLLMASTVEVVADNRAASGEQPFRFPGTGTILTTLLLIGAVATSAAWLVWRSSQSGKLRGQPGGPRLHSAMDTLQKDERIETVRQKIERLEKGGHE